MTTLLEHAFAKAAKLTVAEQDVLARRCWPNWLTRTTLTGQLPRPQASSQPLLAKLWQNIRPA